ncbi:MAG: insulinase family protein [Symbiopectobacterium sp.]
MMSQFYKAWYTPDAMMLYVIGHVETETCQIKELISKAFVSLEGKRTTSASIPTLSLLSAEPIGFVLDKANRDMLSLADLEYALAPYPRIAGAYPLLAQ